MLAFDRPEGLNRRTRSFEPAVKNSPNLYTAVRNTTVRFIHLKIQFMKQRQRVFDCPRGFRISPDRVLPLNGTHAALLNLESLSPSTEVAASCMKFSHSTMKR